MTMLVNAPARTTVPPRCRDSADGVHQRRSGREDHADLGARCPVRFELKDRQEQRAGEDQRERRQIAAQADRFRLDQTRCHRARMDAKYG